METKGRVISLNISKNKGQKKHPVDFINLVEDKGVKNDAHFSSLRQVSLLPITSIEKMQEQGFNVKPGSFAENITTEGIELKSLLIGTRLKINQTLIEITQIGKVCHKPCAIYKQAGYCVMPENGVFAKVLKGGKVINEDKIIVNPK